MNSINSTDVPPYASSDDAIIARALAILEARVDRGNALSSPEAAADYCKLRAAGAEREEFVALFLDSQNRVLECRVMFIGTINSAAVYPREVVKAALACNAGAVIFSHNHPSGVPEPSQSDRAITDRLKEALALVDVRVLDHIVTGGSAHVSFAKRGWI